MNQIKPSSRRGMLKGAIAAGALAAPMLTAILGVIAVMRRRRILLPHGPSMCVASLASAALAVF
jgi:hypothetical protein